MTGQHLTHQLISLRSVDNVEAYKLLDTDTVKRIFQDFDNKYSLPNGQCYIEVSVRGEKAGVCFLKYINKHVIDVHINMTSRFKGYAKIIASKVIKNLFSCPDIKRIETSIPDIYPNVLRFVQMLGFVVEGKKRNAFLKGGEWHNLIIAGILREDYG